MAITCLGGEFQPYGAVIILAVMSLVLPFMLMVLGTRTAPTQRLELHLARA